MTIDSNQKRSKEIKLKIKQKRLNVKSDKFTGFNRENEQFYSTQKYFVFRCTNNVFIDCTKNALVIYERKFCLIYFIHLFKIYIIHIFSLSIIN